MLTSIKNTLGRLARDENGVTIVEFALVAGPFILIIIAILDLGYRGYLDVVADSVAHRVARDATAGTISAKDVEDEALRLIDPLLLSDAVVEVSTRSYFDYTGVGRPEQITFDADDNNRVDEGDCFVDENDNAQHDSDVGKPGLGGADDAVVYEIMINSPNLTGLTDILSTDDRGFRIEALATGRNQPFANQNERELIEYCQKDGINVPVE